jgi:hypothetical protein
MGRSMIPIRDRILVASIHWGWLQLRYQGYSIGVSFFVPFSESFEVVGSGETEWEVGERS